jgi:serine/threonine protein phosphatase PrpC
LTGPEKRDYNIFALDSFSDSLMARNVTLPGNLALVGDAALGWAAACSRRGTAHVREGRPCQDAHAVAATCAAGVPCLVAAVADGHGDPAHDLSEHGAACAVRAAVEEMLAFGAHFRADGGRGRLRKDFDDHFPRRAGHRWREAVLALAGRRPGEVPEDPEGQERLFVRHGTTLLAALVTPEAVVLAQLGDGCAFLVRPDGGVEGLRGDEAPVGVVTDSLCSRDAPRRWRTAALDPAPGGTLVLATDGLVHAFAGEDQLHAFARSLRQRLRDHGREAVADALGGWLDHLSEAGSGDDVTLALVEILPRTESADGASDRTGGARGDGGQQPEGEEAAR